MAVSAIAGKYPQRFPLRISCILKEGNIGVVDSGVGFSAKGDTAASYTFASPLQNKDYVALSNDVANVYDSVEGVPVVERAVNTESLVFGKLITAPDVLENSPAGAQTVWADMLTGGYYRTAMVEMYMGITKVEEAIVKTTNTHSVAIGVGTTLNFNMTGSYANHDLRFVTAAGNGTGVIPFHYVAHGGGGVEATILVGITGPLYAVTGS